VFPADASFEGATFAADASFRGAQFLGTTTFNGATFSGDTWFVDATFSGEVQFDQTTFSGWVTFDQATFAEDAHFFDTTFSGPSQFTEATFKGAVFDGSEFAGEASFQEVRFKGDASFDAATFSGEAAFDRAGFAGKSTFQDTTFSDSAGFNHAEFGGEAGFSGATFSGLARFVEAKFAGPTSFNDSILADEARFVKTTFSGTTSFRGVAFSGRARFEEATFAGDTMFLGATATRIVFGGAQVTGTLTLGLRLSPDGRMTITHVRGPDEQAPGISFGIMSLAHVECRNLDPANLRFRGTRDIDQLSLAASVAWPGEDRNRPRIADEDDLDALEKQDRTPAAALEVERIYRGLRKNFEGQSDRIRAHGWYFAEMEIGRKHSQWPFRRLVRTVYWATSRYGLSPLRPLGVIALTVGVAIAVFSAPWSGSCVKVGSSPNLMCAGWSTATEVALRAVFLQGPADGVVVEGLVTTAVWLLVRLIGAGMLLSFGVAFRNQIAR